LTLVSLSEWETRVPERGTQLHQYRLTDPANQRLAQELTKSRRIEVLELVQGLELRASSYVGRFSLGELTVTIRPKILNTPLLTLFRYAYGLRDLTLYGAVDFIPAQWSFQDLLIVQLAAEASELLQHGIHRDYEITQSDLTNPRGRIDFVRYVTTVARARVTLPCRHHPRTDDTLLNRVVLAGLVLAASLTTDSRLKSHVRMLCEMLSSSVKLETVNQQILARACQSIDRRTSAYEPALRLIGLLLQEQGVTLTEHGAFIRLNGFLFDMNRFFQSLISHFLHDHLEGVDVYEEYRLNGMFRYARGHKPTHRREPSLRPDFVIMRSGQMVAILDAKYRDLWEKKDLPPDMLTNWPFML
jgi:5-methylcytosine-specific restriction enzyme subunit McrC